jgi:DNA-binding CsgD family transcriptional regulator
MKKPILPAGLTDSNIEIFHGQYDAFIQDGIVKPIRLLPKEVHKMLLTEMLSNKKGMAVLKKWFSSVPEMLIQYIRCNYGSFDNVPDFNGSLNKESWDCGLKCHCAGFGKVCQAIVTAREIQVLKEIASDSPDKWVAAKLGISQNTLACHKRNIYRKLGVHSKSGATQIAMRVI